MKKLIATQMQKVKGGQVVEPSTTPPKKPQTGKPITIK